MDDTTAPLKWSQKHLAPWRLAAVYLIISHPLLLADGKWAKLKTQSARQIIIFSPKVISRSSLHAAVKSVHFFLLSLVWISYLMLYKECVMSWLTAAAPLHDSVAPSLQLQVTSAQVHSARILDSIFFFSTRGRRGDTSSISVYGHGCDQMTNLINITP